jgi:hypothetical protein
MWLAIKRQIDNPDDVYRHGRWRGSLSSSGNGWLPEPTLAARLAGHDDEETAGEILECEASPASLICSQ